MAEEGIAKALGKPVEIELGGRKVKLYPLTLNDMAEFENYYRNWKLREALRVIKESEADANLRKELLEIKVSTDEINEFAGTITGMRYLLWLSMRKGQEGLTIEQVGEMLSSEGMQAIYAILMGQLGAGETDFTKIAEKAEGD